MADKKFYIVPNRRTVTSGMKAILVFIFVFLLSANIYEQKASPVNVYRNTNVNYTGIVESDQPLGYKQIREWKKFKTLQVCGWTALGAGSAMVVVGSFVFAFATEDKWDGDGVDPLIALPCTGAALVVASVPMLVFAYKHKRKAKSLSFTASSLSVDLPNGSRQAQPALGLCLHF